MKLPLFQMSLILLISNHFIQSHVKNIFCFKHFKKGVFFCLTVICIWPSTDWMEKLQHAGKDVIWSDYFNIYGIAEHTGLKLIVLWICQNSNLVYFPFFSTSCLTAWNVTCKFYFCSLYVWCKYGTSHHKFIGLLPIYLNVALKIS